MLQGMTFLPRPRTALRLYGSTTSMGCAFFDLTRKTRHVSSAITLSTPSSSTCRCGVRREPPKQRNHVRLTHSRREANGPACNEVSRHKAAQQADSRPRG